MTPEEQEKYEEELATERHVKRLKDRFLDDFFEQKEQQIFDSIKALPVGSVDELTQMHLMLRAMKSLQNEVDSAMNTGKMARMSLGDIDKQH